MGIYLKRTNADNFVHRESPSQKSGGDFLSSSVNRSLIAKRNGQEEKWQVCPINSMDKEDSIKKIEYFVVHIFTSIKSFSYKKPLPLQNGDILNSREKEYY